MTYDELRQSVGWGEEYNFYIQDEEYWISQNKEGRYLTRVSDSYTQEFKTTAELFENGKINGKTILELWDEIKEYF